MLDKEVVKSIIYFDAMAYQEILVGHCQTVHVQWRVYAIKLGLLIVSTHLTKFTHNVKENDHLKEIRTERRY